jgi:L,D-transpeptidase catalytic domain
MNRRRAILWTLAGSGAAGATALAASPTLRDLAKVGLNRFRGQATVAQRVDQFAGDVERRLRREFTRAQLHWPPRELAYVAFKDVRRLEVYGRDTPNTPWAFIRDYPVLGASGTLGPKLRSGDHQVPEGLYRIEALNPNSRFYLSLRLDYPNAFDRAAAAIEGRTNLGGDIMIHGSRFSVGCLAMGNEAAVDLFVLAALAGPQRVRVAIAPTDFREPAARAPTARSDWLRNLYAQLRAELDQFDRGAPR